MRRLRAWRAPKQPMVHATMPMPTRLPVRRSVGQTHALSIHAARIIVVVCCVESSRRIIVVVCFCRITTSNHPRFFKSSLANTCVVCGRRITHAALTSVGSVSSRRRFSAATHAQHSSVGQRQAFDCCGAPIVSRAATATAVAAVAVGSPTPPSSPSLSEYVLTSAFIVRPLTRQQSRCTDTPLSIRPNSPSTQTLATNLSGRQHALSTLRRRHRWTAVDTLNPNHHGHHRHQYHPSVREEFALLGQPPRNDGPPAVRLHARQEAVQLLPSAHIRLVLAPIASRSARQGAQHTRPKTSIRHRSREQRGFCLVHCICRRPCGRRPRWRARDAVGRQNASMFCRAHTPT
jgi:hypothetical protein